MNRRKFLQQTSLSAAAVTLAPTAAVVAAVNKSNGFRVGFLTDVHVNPRKRQKQVCERLSGM